MVDLLDSSGVVWKIQLSGSPATPISIELDGEQMELIGVSSSADSRPNRMIIQDNGVEKVVFCAKVDSKWWLHHDGAVSVFEVVEPGASSSNNNEGELTAPMPGKVLEVLVPEGAKVTEGQPLMVLEAMKMEHRILADFQGTVSAIHYAAGDQVDAGSVLLDLEPENE